MKKFILLLFLIPVFSVSKAQLSFPKGTVLNLNTNINFLYFETEILFHTGTFTVDQYDWEKVSDSVDQRWLIGSCFNGDCWNGLPDKYAFRKDYGINDTTGFIRFHVETYDSNGKSVIKYKVANRSDLSDTAVLTFNIIFEKTVGIKNNQKSEQPVTIYSNSADNQLRIRLTKPETAISVLITDMQGRTIKNLTYQNNEIIVGQLPAGAYIAVIRTANEIYFRKFISN